MSIELLENKLARAQEKLAYCERPAAWPWLSAESALKADGWAQSSRAAVVFHLRALADERRRLGARALLSVDQLRQYAALVRQRGGAKAQRAAELAEIVIRMRERRQRQADERIARQVRAMIAEALNPWSRF